jgi:hypothetical protein
MDPVSFFISLPGIRISEHGRAGDLILFRNIISRSIENPEDLENRQNGRYVGMSKKVHKKKKSGKIFWDNGKKV